MKLRLSGAMVLALALTAGACAGEEEPALETQTTSGVQRTNESVTVTGCLKAGLLEGAYVLTTTEGGPELETATYNLSGTNVEFGDHVGERVTVSGTLRAEQEVASTGVQAVEEEQVRGSSGTPTVATSTELMVKQMTVDTLTPSGERCEE